MNNPVPTSEIKMNSTEKPDFSAFESGFAWLCVIFGYLFCRAFPPSESPLGMLLVSAVCLGITVSLLIRKGAKFCASSIVSGVMSLFFSISLIVSSDSFISMVALVCSAAAYCYFIYSAFGNRTEKGFSDLVLLDLANALLVYPLARFAVIFSAMFSRGNKNARNIAKVLAGFIIAVIPTAVVTSFLSYDGGFVALLEDTFSFLDDFDLFSHLASLFMGIIIAIYVFGLYTASGYGAGKNRFMAEDYRKNVKTLQFAPSLTVGAALIPLTVVYIFYFISQWQYYVSGFTGKLPSGVETYAEYARSGFFELCSVSVINFLILIAVGLLLRRKGKGDIRLLKAVNILFSLMTLVLIGTAMSKMALYIGNYGLTEKRVLASWLMILLALLFVLIIIGQFISKMKLISASAIAVTVMLGIIAMSDHQGIIADYNVDIYLENKTDTIDIYTLEELGVSAIPAKVRLAEFWEDNPDLVPENSYYSSRSKWLFESLIADRIRLDEEPFTAFSIPRYRASSALDESWEKYNWSRYDWRGEKIGQ